MRWSSSIGTSLSYMPCTRRIGTVSSAWYTSSPSGQYCPFIIERSTKDETLKAFFSFRSFFSFWPWWAKPALEKQTINSENHSRNYDMLVATVTNKDWQEKWLFKIILHEEAPWQAWWQPVEYTRWQIEDWTEAGFQGCRSSTVNHHHFVNLIWILMGQKSAERHTKGKRDRHHLKEKKKCFSKHLLFPMPMLKTRLNEFDSTERINPLPIWMPNENIPPFCISHEYESYIISKGVKCVGSCDLRCRASSMAS